MEIQHRQEVYKWGDDPNFVGLPGYIKAESVRKLPKDIRFTEEAIDDLYSAKKKALVNLGLVKLLNAFESWENFHDYRKVSGEQNLRKLIYFFLILVDNGNLSLWLFIN